MCTLSSAIYFLYVIESILLVATISTTSETCSIGNSVIDALSNRDQTEITWKSLDWLTLPQELFGTVAGYYNGDVFILGGKSSDTTFNDNIYYVSLGADFSSLVIDPNTSTIQLSDTLSDISWNTISSTLPASTPNGFTCWSDCSVVYYRYIYIMAPIDENNVGSQRLIIFDMDQKQYVDEATYDSDIPRIIGNACPVIDAEGKRIYLTGGNAYDNVTLISYSEYMDVYDMTNDEWYQGTDLLSGRNTHGCALNQDASKIYLFSGMSGNSQWETNIDSYNIGTAQWENVATSNIPRNDQHCLRDSLGVMVMTGGWANGAGYSGSGMNGGQLTEIFHEQVDESCVLPESMALSYPTLYYSALFVDGITVEGDDEYDVFFIFGGRASSSGTVYDYIQYFVLFYDKEDIDDVIGPDTTDVGDDDDHQSNDCTGVRMNHITFLLYLFFCYCFSRQ